MSKPKLAIVIPAYKGVYFDDTMQSIANQSCKDFVLYIGDDASPDDLKRIVEPYEGKISIRYKHFEKNLGGTDLVAHWDRCINLSEGEEWIWLFSDDDMMDSNCVEKLYQAVNNDPGFDIFHFDLTIIDESSKPIADGTPFPAILTAEEFLSRRLKGAINSTVVEYIFRRSRFEESKGFQNFDLAWGSDDATWIKLAANKGIKNIDGAKVSWRKSRFNISPNYHNRDLLKRKFQAELDFLRWAYGLIINNELGNNATYLVQQLEQWFLQNIKARANFITFKQIRAMLFDLGGILQKQYSRATLITLFSYKSMSAIKKQLKKIYSPAR